MYKYVDGRWGQCKVLGRDEYVGRSVINYGEYGPDETETILKLADKSKLSLDIGCNIGCITQALAFSGFQVIAFEPQPELYEIAKFNCRDALVLNTALGNSLGFVPMPKVSYSEKGNFGGLGIGMTALRGTYEVPICTLDSYHFENVGFMKIDVEGYELEVLKGGTDTILKYKPVMYIEDDRAQNSYSLRKYIRELGYTIEEHKPTLYREDNYFGLKKNIWDRNYASHNLICMPV